MDASHSSAGPYAAGQYLTAPKLVLFISYPSCTFHNVQCSLNWPLILRHLCHYDMSVPFYLVSDTYCVMTCPIEPVVQQDQGGMINVIGIRTWEGYCASAWGSLRSLGRYWVMHGSCMGHGGLTNQEYGSYTIVLTNFSNFLFVSSIRFITSLQIKEISTDNERGKHVPCAIADKSVTIAPSNPLHDCPC